MPVENIYESSKSNVDDELSATQQHKYLFEVAKRQKALIYTFLVYLIAAVILGSVSEAIEPVAQLIMIPIYLAIIIFNIRLCMMLYGTVGKIIMIILGIIPGINYIVVLVANAKANKVLKNAGIKVGFLGVNLSELRNI